MTNFEDKLTIDYFGKLPREALKIIKLMVNKWPNKRIFYNDELTKVSNLKGRSLGGVLGSFAKRDDFLIILKIGKISVNWEGKKLPRPKQAWALNPILHEEHIKKLKDILNNFLLE